MSSGERSRGAVGRGEVMRLLRESQLRSSKSDDSPSSLSSSSSDSILDSSKDSSVELNAGATSIPTNTRSMGRGKLLQRILLNKESVEHDTFQLASAPKPYVSGRGKMFKLLREGIQNVEEKVDDSGVASIDDAIESVSIASSNEDIKPVIKMGTKGTYRYFVKESNFFAKKANEIT